MGGMRGSSRQFRTLVLVILWGCKSVDPQAVSESTLTTPLRAEIIWTDFGVPHVTAKDFRGLGFGFGYASAEAHICSIAEQVIRIRGRRAEFFGPGKNGRFVDEDFGFRALNLAGRAERVLSKMSVDARGLVTGYAAGFNRYVKNKGRENLPIPCRNAEWVFSISAEDVVAHALNLQMAGGIGNLVQAIGSSQPGVVSSYRHERSRHSLGSNGLAVGRERMKSGGGALIANPHFPWEGPFRFFESHLTIPGKLNVYGASLLGAPIINIGFNENLAWTHTVSASHRMALYRLKLSPHEKTSYVVDGKTLAMDSHKQTVHVLKNGRVHAVKRRLYSTIFGPVFATGGLAWGNETAFAVSDLALSAEGIFEQYLEMAMASDDEEFLKALEAHHSSPFVNTIYADEKGNTIYVDSSLVPRLSALGLKIWEQVFEKVPEMKAAWSNGFIGLDGSTKAFMFESHPDAALKGAEPFNRAPILRRADFVANANDSYWAANPQEKIGKVSPFYGRKTGALSMRARMNLATFAGKKKFDREDLEKIILSNESLAARFYKSAVVKNCPRKRTALCKKLKLWDGHFDVDSTSALLWREMWSVIQKESPAMGAFSRENPVATPRISDDVFAQNGFVEKVFVTATKKLKQAGFVAGKTTLGEAQFTNLHGDRNGVPGGRGREGILNLVGFGAVGESSATHVRRGEFINASTGLTRKGYPVNYGSSFVMVAEFVDGKPVARAVMSYSNSGNAESPHSSDQLPIWSRKTLRPILFNRADIENASVRSIEIKQP